MERKKCEICDSKYLKLFYNLKNLPVHIGVVEEPRLFKTLDLQYAECQRCKNVQILELPKLSDVYDSNHNTMVVGKTWKDHNKKFSQFIYPSLTKNADVLEIGDPSAKIASLLTKSRRIKQWDIVEPNAKQIKIPKLKFIHSFFDKNFTTSKKYDALVMSHVFEHLMSLKTLMPIMNKLLKTTGVIMISVPNLQHILEEGSMAPAGINFEHTYYFNSYIIQQLMLDLGFKMKKYEAFGSHSEFYCFEKTSSQKIDFKNIQRDNVKKKIIEIFKAKKVKLSTFATLLKNSTYDGKFIYGAHIQTQMYVYMGLKAKKLTGVLDNDTSKHHKYVYGTELKVFPTSDIYKYKNPLVFCDMGPYTTEITQQILSINPKTKIL